MCVSCVPNAFYSVRRFEARSTRGCNIQVNIFYLQQMHGSSGSHLTWMHFWCMNACVSCALCIIIIIFTLFKFSCTVIACLSIICFWVCLWVCVCLGKCGMDVLCSCYWNANYCIILRRYIIKFSQRLLWLCNMHARLALLKGHKWIKTSCAPLSLEALQMERHQVVINAIAFIPQTGK